MADAKTWKDIALTFAGKLITAGWSAVKACALVGVHRTAWYRRLSPPAPPGITGAAHRPGLPEPDHRCRSRRVHGAAELAGIREPLRHPGVLPDARRGALLLLDRRRAPDRGPRTGRTATAATSAREPAPNEPNPSCVATAPNQLWSWDITMLHGPGKHTYRLYAILDVFSRKVVGHRDRTHRNGRPRRRADHGRGHRKPAAPRRAPRRQRRTDAGRGAGRRRPRR